MPGELTLTAMRGYPGSGKSTRARYVGDETGAAVVCRDDLRMMLHGMYWSGRSELENQVTVAEESAVEAFLKSGTSVIVDACHLNPKYLRKWVKLAAKHGAQFRVEDVKSLPHTCITADAVRASQGERSVGPAVINKLAKQWPISKWPDIKGLEPFNPQPVENIPGLPTAIIVDIDGTLAHMDGRSPYDYSKVRTDTLDNDIAWLVDKLSAFGPSEKVNILIVSGRDDSCRFDTETWLIEQGILFDQLLMRPSGAKDERGNKLPDYLVKYDLFNEHVRGKYSVRIVLDDRDQVVDMWRKLGLKCLQVERGDF